MNKERTTRFAIMLTLFGGGYFIFKYIFLTWFQTFYNNAYTKTLLHIEHIVVVILCAIMIHLGIFLVKYMYFELKTLQYLEDEEHIDAVKKADKHFRDIFMSARYSAYLFLLLLLVITIYQFTQEASWLVIKKSLSFSILFVVILFVLWLVLRKFKFQKSKLVNSVSERFPKNNDIWKTILVFMYIGTLVLIISITVMWSALDANKNVEVKINEKADMPLEISTQNMNNLSINAIIRNNYNSVTELNIEDFQVLNSSVEVLKNNDINSESMDILNIHKEWNKENYKVNLHRTVIQEVYKLNLKEYLREGENKLQILIETKNERNSEIIHFTTDIYLNEGKIEISDKNLKADL